MASPSGNNGRFGGRRGGGESGGDATDRRTDPRGLTRGKVILRADSGFCRNELMSWCEQNQVDYVFGMARNQRLRRIIGAQMREATEQWGRAGKPARVLTEFSYQTRKRKNSGWDRERRVVAKAEQIDGKENPRFVVTSLSAERWAAQALYEDFYCAREQISCACIFRRWLTCWCVACAV